MKILDRQKHEVLLEFEGTLASYIENLGGFVDLKYSDLSHLELKGISTGLDCAVFSDACISFTSFEGSVCRYSLFDKINSMYPVFTSCDLKGCYFDHSRLTSARMDAVNLCKASITYTDFVDTDFSGSDLTEVRAVNTTMRNCKLAGAKMNKETIAGITFAECDLRGVITEEGTIVQHAAVSFSSHGEKGRTLSGYKTDTGKISLMCGCFIGSIASLELYIRTHGDQFAESRTLALKTITTLLT